jgi:predicted transcriptional regulator
MNPMLYIRKKVFGATQGEMAEIVGVTQGTVSRWETGELEPRLPELDLIREEARRRRLRWKDEWFFKAPAAA